VALCVSVVNLPWETITTETQRATEITQRLVLMLKRQNPVDLSATQRRQAGDGIFSEKRVPTAA
jgi:hypothetical protein